MSHRRGVTGGACPPFDGFGDAVRDWAGKRTLRTRAFEDDRDGEMRNVGSRPERCLTEFFTLLSNVGSEL